METLVQLVLEAHETIGQFLKDYWFGFVWIGWILILSNYLSDKILDKMESKKGTLKEPEATQN